MRPLRVLCAAVLATAVVGLPAAGADQPAYFEYATITHDGPLGSADAANDLELDDAGNAYLSGTVLTGAPDRDVLVVKYGPDGAVLWERLLGLPVRGVTQLELDAAGNVYVAATEVEYEQPDGMRLSVTKLDPDGNRLWAAATHVFSDWTRLQDLVVDAAGNAYLTGNEGHSSIVKYGPDGTQLWLDWLHLEVHDLDLDAGGNLHATGNVWVTHDDTRFWTAMYDPAGTQVWTAQYDADPTIDVGWVLTVDAQGSTHVGGTSLAGDDVLVYDADGDELWRAAYGGPNWDQVLGIAVDATGDTVVTGHSRLTADSLYDCLTVRYSPTGTVVWQDRYDAFGDEELCADLTMDDDGTAFVAAQSVGGVTRNRDIATIVYAADGTRVWVGRYDGAVAGRDVPADIAVDEAGRIHVIGTTATGVVDTDIVKITYAPLSVDNVLASLGRAIDSVELPPGTERSFLATLATTQRLLDAGDDRAAARTLDAFIAKVSAQRDKALTGAETDDLVGRTELLLGLLRA